MEITNTL